MLPWVSCEDSTGFCRKTHLRKCAAMKCSGTEIDSFQFHPCMASVPPILIKQIYLVGMRQGKSCSPLVFLLPSAPPAGTLKTQMEIKALGFNRSKSI